MTASHDEVQVVGRYSAGILISSLFLAAVGVWILFAESRFDARNATDVMAIGLLSSGVLTVTYLLLTMRIEARSRVLRLVHFASYRDVSADEIAAVSGANGLTLRLRSGEEVKFFGYGSSVVGLLMARSSSQRAKQAIEEWIRTRSPDRAPVVDHDRTTLRIRSLWVAPAMLALTEVSGFGLYLSR